MAARAVLIGLVFAYVVGSVMRIYQLERALETEKRRVYALADAMEIFRSASKNDCRFDLNTLPPSRTIHATEVKRADMLPAFPPGSRLFIYSLRLDDMTRAEYDKKYRGDALLKYETSVITDKQGKVLSMQWSVP